MFSLLNNFYKQLLCCLLLASAVPSYSQSLVANFTIATPGDSCKSRTVQLNASSSTGSIVSYSWAFKNKVTNESLGVGAGVTILKNFLTPGIYTATLTVTNSTGAQATKSSDIQVYKSPVVNFSTNVREGCPPLNVTFQDLSVPGDGTVTKWEWNYNDGTKDVLLANTSPTHNYSTSNDYTPTLIITNSFGCTASASKANYIKVYPKINPGFLARDNYSCDAPHRVTFENISPLGGPFNFEWDFGDGVTIVDNNTIVYHDYTDAGNYSVRLKAINAPGNCTTSFQSSGPQNVYIGRPEANFTLPAQTCVGTTLTINSTTDPTGLANNGRWIFEDDGTTYNGTVGRHLFNTPGTWQIKYFAFNSFSACKSDTIVHTLDVLPSPVADFTIDKPIGCQAPHQVTFTNTSTGAIQYDWNFGDNTTLSTVDHAPFSKSYTSFNYFAVTLRASNSTGCYSEKTFRYIQNQKPTIDFDYTPQEGCKPLNVSVRVRAQANDPIVGYTYSFSDGTTDILTSLTNQHVFNATGTQTIGVSLTTLQGCTASSPTKDLSVSDICDSDGGGDLGGEGGGGGAIEVTRGGGGCNDKYTFTFRDTITTETVESWDFDGTVVNTNQNPIDHTFPDNIGKKKFLVILTAREAAPSNAIVQHKINVRVVDEKANYTLDRSDICKGLDINFKTIGIDSSNIKKYIWELGDSSRRRVIDNADYFLRHLTYLNGDAKYVYPDTGKFLTKLIIEDKFGCKDSLQLNVPITVKGPLANFVVDKSSFCSANFAVALTDSSKANGTVPIIERIWNYGDSSPDVTITKDTTLHHDYSHTSSYRQYIATLKIKDALGCTDQHEERIQSYAPKANFFSYDTLRCGKFDIFFYNQSSAFISDNNRITWEYGDGITSKGYYGNHTFLDTGRFTIKLKIIDDGGCVDSISKSNYVKLIRPKAKFDVGSDTSKCVGTFSLPFVSRSDFSKQYSWDFGDGSSSQTNNVEVSHFYERAGLYDVKLSVTGIDGCKDDTTRQIRIKGPRGDLRISSYYLCTGTAFSAKVVGQNVKDFYWDFNDLTTTTDFVKKDSVSHFYQNPGKYVPNIILLSPENCQITLEASDTVLVDKLNAGHPANIECGDSNTTIKANTALNLPTNYFWQGPAGATYLPDNTHLEAKVDIPGIYYLNAIRPGCGQKDSVLVTTSGVVPTADAGVDKKIDCIDAVAKLNGSTTTADTRFKWKGPDHANFFPNDSTHDPLVTIPGDYVLTVIQKECTTTDRVTISACSLDATDATLELCANRPGMPFFYYGYDLTQLNNQVLGTVPANVSWFSDKQFTQPVSQPGATNLPDQGVYFAKIVSTDGTETARAKLDVTVRSYVHATINSSNDTICENHETILLTPTNLPGGDLTYQWFYDGQLTYSGKSAKKLEIKNHEQSGLYILQVANPYCPTDADSITLKIYESPRLSFEEPFINIMYGQDDSIVLPLNITLNNQHDISNITWTPDEYLKYNKSDPLTEQDGTLRKPFYIAQNDEISTTYKVSVTAGHGDGSCTSTAKILVNNYLPVKIPNAFTPNYDGLNDRWVIRGLAKYPKIKMKVYSQWGKLIFENNDGYASPWDGTYNGERVPFGTYYYVIDFLGSNDGSDYSAKGWVLIME